MSSTPNPLFTQRPPERTPFNPIPWVIAGVVILLGVVALAIAGHHKPGPPPNAILPLDRYASSLTISKIAMSESESLSGGKSTYIDGFLKNTGTKTVTAATVQVLFANDMALPPQVETLPLTLIRTHQPYVDTQPISAAPIAPGDECEFRLIFEDLNGNWNQQLPEIHVTQASTK